tara:strand:+ start:53 stop:496 length:444 start_codon:yes stop_codon:yes gene_type:complete
MRLAIKCHEMYEDLALHIKEELVKVFTADDWGKYTPSNWRSEIEKKTGSYTPGALVDKDGLGCFDEFEFIISEEDIFEMYIKGGPTGDNHIFVWNMKETGRTPTVKDIMDYFIMLADFEKGLYIRRRVVVEGADIRDADDPGVEHLI